MSGTFFIGMILASVQSYETLSCNFYILLYVVLFIFPGDRIQGNENH